jgi:hypothetical protein
MIKMVSELEEKDYRCRILIKSRGEDHRVDIDARMIPVRDAVGRTMGMFYIDFGQFRIEMGQDLLDDLFDEVIWFATHERVKEAVKDYFDRM